MSGKGSNPRPYSVDQKTFAENWEKTFRKDKREEEDAKLEDEEWQRLEELQKQKQTGV